MKKITACTLDCPDACSLIIEKKDDGRISIRGNPHHPITAGFTCAKIKHHPKRLDSPYRITSPMLKVEGKWRKISWHDALDLCAEKINALRSEPASILHCHGEGAKGALKQLNKLFFAQIGSTRTNGSLCDAAGFIAGINDFGSRLNNDILDVLNAKAIVNWGKAFTKSSIHTASIVQKARKQGARLLTVSPVINSNSDTPDDFIRIRPGTDRFLAAAVIKKLLETHGIDSKILSHSHAGYSFKTLLENFTFDALAGASGVTHENITTLFNYYSNISPVATFIGAGLQRYLFGGENVRFINALALLSGNVGIAGGGAYFHLHSLENLNVGGSFPNGASTRRALPVAALGKSILDAHDPPIKFIWINGSNVLNQAPDSHSIMRAFNKVPFKVVVDAFMTDTALHSDLFLPTTLMLEQEDIIGSYLHHYVHYVEQVVVPPVEAKSDDWILREIGQRLNPPIYLPDNQTWFRNAVNTPHLTVSLEELKEQKFAKAHHPQVVYSDLKFDHPDGKYRFPLQLHPEPQSPEGFPLRLLSLIRSSAIHSQILPDDHKLPLEVLISPDCPAYRHLDVKKDIWMVSPVARLKVTVQTAEGIHPEVVLAQRGTWMKYGGGLNQLIEAKLTDIGKGAAFYAQHVRLEN